MKVDLVRDEIADALRLLRRGPGELTPERVAAIPALIDHLGAGSTEMTYTSLMRIADEHGTDPRTDIGAFFYMSGWNHGGHSLEQRRSDYAEEFFVHDRTGLRRSDRGVYQLVDIIRDRFAWTNPVAYISAFQSGANLRVHLSLAIEEGTQFRDALILINEDDDYLTDELDWVREERSKYIFSRARLPMLTLDTTKAADQPLIELQIHWEMPIWPIFELLTHFVDPRLMVHLRVHRRGVARIVVEWIHPRYALPDIALNEDGDVWMLGRVDPEFPPERWQLAPAHRMD